MPAEVDVIEPEALVEVEVVRMLPLIPSLGLNIAF